MAEDENNEQSVADALTDTEEGGGSGGSLKKIIRILLPVGVLVLAVGAGHMVRRMVGPGESPPAQAAAEENPSPEPPRPPAAAEEYAYYDLEPIVVNLNEPRLARYIKATLTLVFRKEDHDAAVKTIEKKVPALRNCLILYLADCSLEEVRGAKNLNRILRDVQDSFNDRLWPDARPLIVKVDYKQWTVQ